MLFALFCPVFVTLRFKEFKSLSGFNIVYDVSREMKARVIDQWPRFAIVVDLDVTTEDENYGTVEFILDTGFTGHITLPKSYYRESMFTLKEKFNMADDRPAEFMVGFFSVSSGAIVREQVPTVFMGSSLMGLSFLRDMHATGKISHGQTIELSH